MATKARRDHLAKYGVDGCDARRLESALCTIADFERAVAKALTEAGVSEHALRDTCAAIRRIVDGPDG